MPAYQQQDRQAANNQRSSPAMVSLLPTFTSNHHGQASLANCFLPSSSQVSESHREFCTVELEDVAVVGLYTKFSRTMMTVQQLAPIIGYRQAHRHRPVANQSMEIEPRQSMRVQSACLFSTTPPVSSSTITTGVLKVPQ